MRNTQPTKLYSAAVGLYPHELEAAEEAISKSVGEWVSTAHADKQLHMEALYEPQKQSSDA